MRRIRRASSARPTSGHKGWVAVVLDTGPDWETVAKLVREAYRRIAPKLAGLVEEAWLPRPGG